MFFPSGRGLLTVLGFDSVCVLCGTLRARQELLTKRVENFTQREPFAPRDVPKIEEAVAVSATLTEQL